MPGGNENNPNLAPGNGVGGNQYNGNNQNGMNGGDTNNAPGYANTNSLPWTTNPPSGNPNGSSGSPYANPNATVPGNNTPPSIR